MSPTPRPIHVLRFAALVTLLLVVPQALVPVAADHPQLTSYDELTAIVEDWRAKGVQVDVPATSSEGRDIHLAKIGHGPVTVLFINGLHSDEPAGTEAFIDLVYAFLGDVDRSFSHAVHPTISRDDPVFRALDDPAVREMILDRVTILGFPMIDPDGTEASHASMGLGNVDYWTQATPESRAIRHVVDTYRPDFMMDNHGTSRPDTELRIGLMRPVHADAAVVERTTDASELMWRAAAAVGVDVKYYEEEIFNEQTPPTREPLKSANDAYWDALTKVMPVTQGAYQLRGIPVTFTEVKDFKAGDPVSHVLEGASIQEVTMTAVLLDEAGLLAGARPLATPVNAGETVLDLPAGTTHFYARVAWTLPGQDYTLELRAEDGTVVASTGPDPTDAKSAHREARALYVPSALDAGRYTLTADAEVTDRPDGAHGAARWRVPDADTPTLTGVVDHDVPVTLTREDHSHYSSITPVD